MGGRCPQNPLVHSGENHPLGAPGLRIWGDVKFRADAVMGGEVKGSVTGTDKIIVTGGTVVTGAVEGSEIRVQGEVHGGVAGRGLVWIGPQAKVKMGCRAKALRIEPGAEFRGELQVG